MTDVITKVSIGGQVYPFAGGGSEVSADDVSYDNTTSGMVATNVQEAVDEINEKIEVIQYATLPTITEENVGQVVQYIGATTQNYTNGYFYKCTSDGQDPETFSREQVNVQPSGGASGNYLEKVSSIPETIEQNKVIMLELTDGRTQDDYGHKTGHTFRAGSKTETMSLYRGYNGSVVIYVPSIPLTAGETVYYTDGGNPSVGTLVEVEGQTGMFAPAGYEGNSHFWYSNDYISNTAEQTEISVPAWVDCESTDYPTHLSALDDVATFNNLEDGHALTYNATTQKWRNEEVKTQFSTMPTASAQYSNKPVQYIGTTDSNYTQGYFYISYVPDPIFPTTYAWKQIDVQPNTGGDSILVDTLPDVTTATASDTYILSTNGYTYKAGTETITAYDCDSGNGEIALPSYDQIQTGATAWYTNDGGTTWIESTIAYDENEGKYYVVGKEEYYFIADDIRGEMSINVQKWVNVNVPNTGDKPIVFKGVINSMQDFPTPSESTLGQLYIATSAQELSGGNEVYIGNSGVSYISEYQSFPTGSMFLGTKWYDRNNSEWKYGFEPFHMKMILPTTLDEMNLLRDGEYYVNMGVDNMQSGIYRFSEDYDDELVFGFQEYDENTLFYYSTPITSALLKAGNYYSQGGITKSIYQNLVVETSEEVTIASSEIGANKIFDPSVTAGTYPAGTKFVGLGFSSSTGRVKIFDEKSSGGTEIFTITLTQDNNNWVADKTPAEVKTAYNDGKVVQVYIDPYKTTLHLTVSDLSVESYVFGSVYTEGTASGTAMFTANLLKDTDSTWGTVVVATTTGDQLGLPTDITNPTEGETLTYDATNQVWKNTDNGHTRKTLFEKGKGESKNVTLTSEQLTTVLNARELLLVMYGESAPGFFSTYTLDVSLFKKLAIKNNNLDFGGNLCVDADGIRVGADFNANVSSSGTQITAMVLSLATANIDGTIVNTTSDTEFYVWYR